MEESYWQTASTKQLETECGPTPTPSSVQALQLWLLQKQESTYIKPIVISTNLGQKFGRCVGDLKIAWYQEPDSGYLSSQCWLSLWQLLASILGRQSILNPSDDNERILGEL